MYIVHIYKIPIRFVIEISSVTNKSLWFSCVFVDVNLHKHSKTT